jgi:hypothetical protein
VRLAVCFYRGEPELRDVHECKLTNKMTLWGYLVTIFDDIYWI